MVSLSGILDSDGISSFSTLGRRDREYYAGNGYYCDAFGNCERSRWYSWGRWVAMVVIIAVFFFVLFSVGLLTARRRRARGLRPFYGTAWIAPKFNPNNNANQWHVPPANGNNYGNNNYHGSPAGFQPAPPAYTPPAGGYFAPSPVPGSTTGNNNGGNAQYEMQSPYSNGANQNGNGNGNVGGGVGGQAQGQGGQQQWQGQNPDYLQRDYTGQSNNPYFAAVHGNQPSSPPPAHLNSGGKI